MNRRLAHKPENPPWLLASIHRLGEFIDVLVYFGVLVRGLDERLAFRLENALRAFRGWIDEGDDFQARAEFADYDVVGQAPEIER